MATYRQRIIALYQGGVISKSKYDELIARERRIRGGLELVRIKLDKSYDEFRARAFQVASCRGDGHWWQRSDYDPGYRPTGGVFREPRTCARCGMIRVTVVNAIGQADRHVYFPPANYKLEGVRTTRGDWKQLIRHFELGFDLDELEAGLGEGAEVVPLHRTA